MRTVSSGGSSDNRPISECTSATGDSFSPTAESSTSVARDVAGQREFLRRALGELTPRQRFVVECFYGLRGDREYTFREIAGFMGVSVSTAHQHYTYGMRTLERVADTEHSDLYEGTYTESRTSATTPSEGVEFESVCLSPFVPHRYGFSPDVADGVAHELYDAQEAFRKQYGDLK